MSKKIYAPPPVIPANRILCPTGSYGPMGHSRYEPEHYQNVGVTGPGQWQQVPKKHFTIGSYDYDLFVNSEPKAIIVSDKTYSFYASLRVTDRQISIVHLSYNRRSECMVVNPTVADLPTEVVENALRLAKNNSIV